MSGILFLLTCLLASLFVAVARNSVDPEFRNEVLIAYKNGPECNQFIENHFVHSALENDRRPQRESFFTIDSIRSSIMPLMLGYNANYVAEQHVPVVETTRYPFYDSTVVQFAGERSSLKNDIGDLVGEFRWLKHVQIDRVILPKAIDRKTFEEAVKSIPCIRFAEATKLRSVAPPSSFFDENLRGQDKEDAVSSKSAEPGNSRSVQRTPNDPDFGLQWYHPLMNLEAAWELWTGPTDDAAVSESVIGITDTGCDVSHPDLRDRFWKNTAEICGDNVDNDNNGYVDDCYGWNFYARNANLTDEFAHGTSVSSAVTATTDNGIGIAGTCWTCKIMCLRVGKSSMTVGAFVEAVNYARGWDVRIINYSAGGEASSSEMSVMLQAAKSDMLFVVAAGNAACDLDSSATCVEDTYPANYGLSNILAIGATTATDQIATFSNFGGRTVDVFSPGKSTYLAVPTSGRYGHVSGTSFSSPLVAGVVGLLRSKFPGEGYKAIADCIVANCRKLPVLDGKAKCGGVIDAKAALICAEKASLSPSENPSNGVPLMVA